MVGDVAPVWGVEEEHISLVAWREPADIFGAKNVRRVCRAGAEGFCRREPETGTRQVHHQRQRLTERTPWVEVGGECQDRSLLGQEAGRGEGQVEEEPASGEEHSRYVAPRYQDGRFMLRSFQVVHATGAELEGQRDRTPLGELVGMQPGREPVLLARLEVASCLWHHFMDHELHVLSRAIELGRDSVCPQEGRIYVHKTAPSRDLDRTQGLQLRLAVQAVARLRLCGHRPVLEHPTEVTLEGGPKIALTTSTCRRDRRADAAIGGMDLLVGSPGGAQLELRSPITKEGRVRMAVYEARKRYLPTPVNTLVVLAGWKVPQDLHGRADRGDAVPCYGYRSRGVDAQCSEFPAPERSRSLRGDGGREVVDQ